MVLLNLFEMMDWINCPNSFAVSGKNGKLHLPAVLFDHFGKKADAPLKGGVLFRRLLSKAMIPPIKG